MKKNILTTIGLTAFFTISIVSLNVFSDSGTTSVHAFSGGSPGGRTSSPGDGTSCTACHTGTINSGTGVNILTSTIPSSGYVPGQTYTITAQHTEAGINKIGFEVTAERDADDSKVGTMVITDGTRTKTVANGVTHNGSAGSSGSGSNSWSFDWIAPSSATGNVTFYGAFNATNGNGATSGDKVYSASPLSVSEDVSVGLSDNLSVIYTTLFPNPVKSSFEISTSETIDNVIVYNLSGKEMFNINQINNKFDASSLPSGIYFVQINTENGLVTKKIIKE
jgi:hypothetical protein